MNLVDVQTELLRLGVSASLRGEGSAEFIFAEHNERVVELSRNRDEWWAEFWDASTDEYAAPFKQEYFKSSAEALKATSAWLLSEIA